MTLHQTVKDFNYINSRKRRPSEYEALNLHIQPAVDNRWDRGNSYIRSPEGRPGFLETSTALRHPDWYAFRDPAALWQRPYMRQQAEVERSIARVTESLAWQFERDLDPTWCTEILAGHYSVWSFVEWGLFRGMFSASREALSDTIVAAMLFETFDRQRHAQDVVHYLMALEENLPDFDSNGAKAAWLESPRYQPMRRMVEQLGFGTHDWGESIIATNLCFDLICGDVGLHRLLGDLSPAHGDVVSKLIITAVENDRRRELTWTQDFVRMVTADGLETAEANRDVIAGWITEWTARAVAAVEPLAPLYDCLAAAKQPFSEVLGDALARQQAVLGHLGIRSEG